MLLQEMQIHFLVLPVFCKILDKVSPLKRLPVKEEGGKGWLLSAPVPPFPVFFRITKVFYCPCAQQSLRSSDGRRDGEASGQGSSLKELC